jgi:hypothetical protein
VGRAFSLGWSIFRFRWRTLIAAALVLTVPAYALQVLVTVYVSGTMERWGAQVQELYVRALAEGRTVVLTDLPALPIDALLLSFASGLIVSLAGLLAGAALIHIIGWTYGGGSATLGQALSRTLGRAPSLIGSSLIMALVVFAIIAGSVLLMVALVAAIGFSAGLGGLLIITLVVAAFAAVLFVGVRWTFVGQTIMLEGRGAIGALGRSWRLASGSSWRVLGYLLLLVVVLFLIGLVAGTVSVLIFGIGVDIGTGVPLPFSPVRAAGQAILPAFAAILLSPFYTAVLTLLYYDLRWRAGETLAPPPA